MKTKLLFVVILVLSLFPGMLRHSKAQDPAIPEIALPDKFLSTLKKEHPRLHASVDKFAELKAKIQADETLKTWYDAVVERGIRILDEAPSIYEIPDGLRLLNTSRRVVGRIYTLGFLWQMTGDDKFAGRAWKELEAASKFPDWNPKHFLDVGEMTHAFAIGYDWMYTFWNTDQKNTIRSAIIEKGLSRAMLAYEKVSLQNHGWWIDCEHNWNQVCNGGIGMGALAIADEDPKLSEYILRKVIKYLPYAMVHFGPDGAWNEGPGYWGYSTQYNVAILSGLFSALGTDFGLSDIEGFSKTGLFPIYMTGPVNRSFNYADAGDGPTGGAQMFWFAGRFHLPAAAIYQKKLTRHADPLDILWYPAGLMKERVPEMPLAACFRFAEVATMRSSWEDKNSWFVGFKAGDNRANHSNLDLGSFVLDAFGKRWAVDLGADNYNAPGYFSTGAEGKRWNYYRMRAEGHNTLVLNPGQKADQNPLASTRMIQFEEKGMTAFAVADLTPAYASDANSVKRGIALAGGKSVVIQDEVKTQKPAKYYWFMHTRSEVKISGDGRSAILTIDSARVQVNIIGPAKAKLSLMNAIPLASSPQPKENNKNEGVRKLFIELQNITDEKVVVEVGPVKTKNADAKPFYRPLDDWK